MKKLEFNIILFLALYFFLKYAFYFYVGLTTPGGKFSFPFLTAYLNFPYWLTLIVSTSAKYLLGIFGYNVYQLNDANVTIRGSKGVTIAWGCLGVGALSMWFAFIIAHRARVKFKVKWILGGLIVIFLINILRIDMIVLSNYYGWKYFQSFNAHTSFDLLTYMIILLLMLLFVWIYSKKRVIVDNG